MQNHANSICTWYRLLTRRPFGLESVLSQGKSSIVLCSLIGASEVCRLRQRSIPMGRRSTESIHCIFPIHFFELFPGPDLQKPDIPCYIAIPVIYVDRGQDKLRKSALKKCNVRIRVISKNFYHRNIRFLGATRSKVISHRVGSSSSWSVVLCPLKPTFWW